MRKKHKKVNPEVGGEGFKPNMRELVRTSELTWPSQLSTDAHNQKIVQRLKDVAEADPNNLQKQLAFENARRLQGLAPRIQELKWQELMFADRYFLIGWDSVTLSLQKNYYASTDASTQLKHLEGFIKEAERAGGIPEEVSAMVWEEYQATLRENLAYWIQEVGREPAVAS